MTKMGAHQSSASAGVDWLTPPDWISKLGKFDLDPCAAEPMPWETAGTMWTRRDNGLSKNWFGRVFCNPPYGPPPVIEPWMARMADHNNGIALIFARTDTNCWHKYVFPVATGALFIRGRPNFYLTNGTRSKANCGAPVALISYGAGNLELLLRSGLPGKPVVFNIAAVTPATSIGLPL